MIATLENALFGTDAWSEATVRDEVDAPDRRTVVMEDGGTVVGYAVTMLVAEVADLQRIAVRPDHRRRGVAGEMLEHTLERLAAAGADRVLLEVSAGNTGALAFYLSTGFVEIDRRRRYYRDGSDAVVMRRSLGRAERGRRG